MAENTSDAKFALRPKLPTEWRGIHRRLVVFSNPKGNFLTNIDTGEQKPISLYWGIEVELPITYRMKAMHQDRGINTGRAKNILYVNLMPQESLPPEL